MQGKTGHASQVRVAKSLHSTANFGLENGVRIDLPPGTDRSQSHPRNPSRQQLSRYNSCVCFRCFYRLSRTALSESLSHYNTCPDIMWRATLFTDHAALVSYTLSTHRTKLRTHTHISTYPQILPK